MLRSYQHLATTTSSDATQETISHHSLRHRRELSFPSPANVNTTERQLSVAVGSWLVLHALFTRSRRSLVTGPLGLALIWHGHRHRSPFYAAFNIDTAKPRLNQLWETGPIAKRHAPFFKEEGSSQASVPSDTIEIRRAVTIDKPATELYNYWRRLENLPTFMHHLQQVTQTDELHSHWVAQLVGGMTVAWEAEILEEIPDQRIVWRTLPGSQVDQIGRVTFESATGGRGTVVDVDITYRPPGGIVGETFARLLNSVTAQQLKNDIYRFKNLMETGEIPTTDGQTSGRRA